MADIGRIITTGAKTKVGKEFTKDLIEQAQGLIKTGKTTEATKLLQKKKTPVKVGEKETTGHVKHFLPFFEYTPIKKSVRRKK